MMRGALTTIERAADFVNAGNATITIRSKRTEKRFTFRVRKSDDGKCVFVALLTGPDNESDYTYLGVLKNNEIALTRKSPMAKTAAPLVAFDFFGKCLTNGVLHPDLEIFHEGRCGRCNRKLTVPESVESGFGPECSTKVPFRAVAVPDNVVLMRKRAKAAKTKPQPAPVDYKDEQALLYSGNL